MVARTVLELMVFLDQALQRQGGDPKGYRYMTRERREILAQVGSNTNEEIMQARVKAWATMA